MRVQQCVRYARLLSIILCCILLVIKFYDFVYLQLLLVCICDPLWDNVPKHVVKNCSDLPIKAFTFHIAHHSTLNLQWF